ncbi:MAG: ribose 5-phosphate isomerase B [Candidatus Aminicenantes bacterium]|nr:ribose 5-phosphate isomerase B [Candidatus Aminicenantes bacterium]
MKIAIASDHAGYVLKAGVIKHLSGKGVVYQDYGCFSEESVDYVDFAVSAMEAVLKGECDRAILVCGTGLGMGIVANKFKGIRATPCVDAYMAEMSRSHNNSNCLTLGGRILPIDEALPVVDTWLEASFESGRHGDRLQKIKDIENKHFRL